MIIMKIYYEIAAILTTVIFVLPVAFYSAGVAFIHALRLFPHQVCDIFDKLYNNKEL